MVRAALCALQTGRQHAHRDSGADTGRRAPPAVPDSPSESAAPPPRTTSKKPAVKLARVIQACRCIRAAYITDRRRQRCAGAPRTVCAPAPHLFCAPPHRRKKQQMAGLDIPGMSKIVTKIVLSGGAAETATICAASLYHTELFV